MGTAHGPCVCREDHCLSRGSNGPSARSVKLEWDHPLDVTAAYVEATIDSTVPGTQFTPICFSGGYLAIQDSPDHLNGVQRILFVVDNQQLVPPKRNVTFSPSTQMESSPIPNGDDSPRTHETPGSAAKSESSSVSSSVQTHFIGTPSRPRKSTIIGDDSPSWTPRLRESNIQVLHFGSKVNVSQSSEAVHFKDDFTRWEIGQTLRFLVVHAGTPRCHTCYAAYINFDGLEWQHLASVSVGYGKPFVDHCSHIEDFRRDGASVGQERKAQFGPVWFRRSDGTWQPSSKATFQAAQNKAEQDHQTNVHTESVPGTGRRILATGGESLPKIASAGSKVGTTRKVILPEGSLPPEILGDAPQWFPQWFHEMPHS
mmetsp:Transcript_104360/g.164665  ORF Transcript_104360/g.164665 Transcript_104360/m.164665 type:complete len:371 (+) Transcript_104360:77-1189(+)